MATKTTVITLTIDERLAFSDYPNKYALHYIWMGILATRELMTPEDLSEVQIKYLHPNVYEVTMPDYSLAP
jgi:hypothetical protein